MISRTNEHQQPLSAEPDGPSPSLTAPVVSDDETYYVDMEADRARLTESKACRALIGASCRLETADGTEIFNTLLSDSKNPVS